MEYSYRGLQILNDIGLPIYFVVGNHDLHKRTTRDVHSVRMFNEMSNFKVIDRVTVEDGLLFSPYLFEHEYPALIQHSTELWAFAGHFEFKNFVITGYNTVMDHGPDHRLFAGVNKIFSGHFHKRQVQDNVHYIGNAFPMDFGDVADKERGMCTYHVLEDKVIYKDWDDCPKYAKVKLSAVMEDKWNPEPKLRVKCVVDIEIGYQDAQDLREAMIEAYDLRDFILEEDREAKLGLLEGEDIKMTESALEFTSVDDLVVKQLELLKEDKALKIDAASMIAIYKDLKVELTTD
jgi:DNA repair exonuclease SbcCD nuclease subunit